MKGDQRPSQQRRTIVPWVWCRIVKMCAGPAEESPVLSSTAKLLYCELAGLCLTRGGATIGAGALGRRLALKRKTVEHIRTDLVRVGLLDRRERGDGRCAAWIPTMPMQCRPSVRRLTDDDVEWYAEKLALHIMGKRAQSFRTDEGGVPDDPPNEALLEGVVPPL